jgi:hypothetical protein
MRQFLIGAWLAGFLAPAFHQERASEIAGVVKFEGVHKPRKINVMIDGDKHGGPGRDGKDVFEEDVVLGSNQELANVLVRVKGSVAGSFDPPKNQVELELRAYSFRPRIVVLRAGQTLRVKNTDLDNLNVHGRARRNKEFNVNLARGASWDFEFTESEMGIRTQHDCCPWQVAWIHVVDHPFFAVTGKDGAFKIANLPAGTYEIEAWHEIFGTRTATVTVGTKEAKAQDFTFTVPNK